MVFAAGRLQGSIAATIKSAPRPGIVYTEPNLNELFVIRWGAFI